MGYGVSPYGSTRWGNSLREFGLGVANSLARYSVLSAVAVASITMSLVSSLCGASITTTAADPSINLHSVQSSTSIVIGGVTSEVTTSVSV